MTSLKSLGTVVLALLACGRGGSEKATPVASSEPEAPVERRERVVTTLPLELGEGDDRALKATLWPADGAAALEVGAGTRIEKLWEPTGGRRPATLPDAKSPQFAFWRVRVTEGPHKGLVAYARSYAVQAAR